MLYTITLNFYSVLHWQILARRLVGHAWAISGSATRRMVQQLYMAVLPHPLLTLDSNLLRVKVITVFEVQNCFSLRSESKDLDSFCHPLQQCVADSLLVSWRHSSPKPFSAIDEASDNSRIGLPHPDFWLRPYSLETTKICCLTKSSDPVLERNLMVCDCQAR